MLRRILQLIAVLAVASTTSLHAAVLLDMRSVEAAPVVAVQSARAADIVLLGAGFDAGLRQGMVCSISRGTTKIADVLLVGLRLRAGAALILDLAPGQSIRPGDIATVKTLNS